MRGTTPDRPSIEVVLRHYGADDVPAAYNWRAMKCCFHDDRNASAQVNTDEGFFRCFTCDLWGDGYELIKIREGVRFPEAVRIYEGLAGGNNSSLGGEPAGGTGLPGRSWHHRGPGKSGKAGGGRYNGTYSR